MVTARLEDVAESQEAVDFKVKEILLREVHSFRGSESRSEEASAKAGESVKVAEVTQLKQRLVLLTTKEHNQDLRFLTQSKQIATQAPKELAPMRGKLWFCVQTRQVVV